jgi:hypothetical protein
MGSPTTKAFPEFSFTAEDMKIVSKLKIITNACLHLSLIIRRIHRDICGCEGVNELKRLAIGVDKMTSLYKQSDLKSILWTSIVIW